MDKAFFYKPLKTLFLPLRPFHGKNMGKSLTPTTEARLFLTANIFEPGGTKPEKSKRANPH